MNKTILAALMQARAVLDAQPVPEEGRMYWHPEKGVIEIPKKCKGGKGGKKKGK